MIGKSWNLGSQRDRSQRLRTQGGVRSGHGDSRRKLGFYSRALDSVIWKPRSTKTPARIRNLFGLFLSERGYGYTYPTGEGTHENEGDVNAGGRDLGKIQNPRGIQEKTSGSAIIDKLMEAYLGGVSLPQRGRGHAQDKRAHTKTSKAAAR